MIYIRTDHRNSHLTLAVCYNTTSTSYRSSFIPFFLRIFFSLCIFIFAMILLLYFFKCLRTSHHFIPSHHLYNVFIFFSSILLTECNGRRGLSKAYRWISAAQRHERGGHRDFLRSRKVINESI